MITTRREFLASSAAGALLAQEKQRPNILLISCENLGPHLGCYGETSVLTPALDRFAATAVRFDRAYAVSGVGAVSRSSIQTGMYPSTIGTHFNGRAALPAFVKPFTEYLKQAGYFITPTNPKAKAKAPPDAPTFTWRRLDAVNPRNVRLRGQAYLDTIRPVKVAQRRGETEAPFPPQFEDAEESRRDWANYHELIALLDRQFAARIAGVPDSAIVMFFSEYGFTLREGNSAAYESGTRVPLLVRIPGVTPVATSRRVMLLDLAPSILNLAGVAIPTHMQGQAFLGDRLPPQRRSVFATLDRADLRYEVIRSIRLGSQRYVRNYTRGTEELFDSEKDANEVKNLAESDPATTARLREQLDRWRADTRDLGLIPEAELAVREALHRTRYAVGRLSGFEAMQQRLNEVAMTKEDARIQAAFADPDAAVRALACAKGGSKFTAELSAALSDLSGCVRVQAAGALLKNAQQHAPAARKVLAKELKSQEEWLRFAALAALEESGDRDSALLAQVAALAAAADPNPAVVALAKRITKG